MRIKQDDLVLVISGKDRGKRGKVRRAFPEEGKVVVESVNLIKRHSKARGTARQGGIIEQEAPISACNVILICTKCNRPTRVGSRLLQGEKKARVCRACHEVID